MQTKGDRYIPTPNIGVIMSIIRCLYKGLWVSYDCNFQTFSLNRNEHSTTTSDPQFLVSTL